MEGKKKKSEESTPRDPLFFLCKTKKGGERKRKRQTEKGGLAQSKKDVNERKKGTRGRERKVRKDSLGRRPLEKIKESSEEEQEEKKRRTEFLILPKKERAGRDLGAEDLCSLG